jgi:nucleotide-binding universal stress UspA family protein
MKKILIALDYEPSAQKVAETGANLAASMKAEIILLHVIVDSSYYTSLQYSPIMGYTGISPADVMQLVDTDKVIAAAQKYLDKSKHHLNDESIKTIIKEGDFAESILETAKEVHADMIVMGSHSRRGLEKILMGSVTEKVLNESSIPMFIVPTKRHS